MSMIGFPLLLIPLAICNIIVFLMPGVSFAAPVVTVPLMSGVAWTVTLSDVLLALGIVLLLFEVIKGARPGAKYFTDHLLSLLVFGGAVAEFLLLPQFATSTYFLLIVLALVDFISGIGLRARRRAMVVAPVSKAARSREEAAAPAPRFEPAPAHPVQEPLPAAQPEPTPYRPEPGIGSPEAASAASGRVIAPPVTAPDHSAGAETPPR